MKLFFIIFLSVAFAAAEPSSYYDLSFENLSNFGSFSTSTLKGKKSLWILFQPECASCERQFRDLQCLPASTPVLAVGFWGSKEELSRALKKSQSVQATKGLFPTTNVAAGVAFKGKFALKQTPTVLFLDEEGFVFNERTAFVPCEEVKNLLKTKKRRE